MHDVELKSGPEGRQEVPLGGRVDGLQFKRKLTVPGTYKIICSLHEEMRMTIKVRVGADIPRAARLMSL